MRDTRIYTLKSTKERESGKRNGGEAYKGVGECIVTKEVMEVSEAVNTYL